LGYNIFIISFWVHDMDTLKQKATTIGIIYGVVLVEIIVFGVMLKWV